MVNKLLAFRTSVAYPFLLLIFLINIGALIFFARGLWGTYRLFTNISYSMEPTIQLGDLIVTQEKNMHTYVPADIITFHSKTHMTQDIITHRIVEKQGAIYRTKGDSNIYTDPFIVTPHQIIGKTVNIIPLVGYWIIAINTLLGRVMFMYVPMIIIIGTEVANIRNQKVIKNPPIAQGIF